MHATHSPDGDTGRRGEQARVVGERASFAVEGHQVQVFREVLVPRLVCSAARDDRPGVRRPGDRAVCVVAGREIARRRRAVGGDHVDVERPVEDPVLAVEPGEEPLDLARRLPRHVLGVVPLVAGAAREGQTCSVGRPGEVAEAVDHGAHLSGLARCVDREHVERRVLLVVTAPADERQPASVR